MWETLFQELGINLWNRKEQPVLWSQPVDFMCSTFFLPSLNCLGGKHGGKEKGLQGIVFVDEDAE